MHGLGLPIGSMKFVFPKRVHHIWPGLIPLTKTLKPSFPHMITANRLVKVKRPIEVFSVDACLSFESKVSVLQIEVLKCKNVT
jgi:hypothetical protein